MYILDKMKLFRMYVSLLFFDHHFLPKHFHNLEVLKEFTAYFETYSFNKLIFWRQKPFTKKYTFDNNYELMIYI